MRQDRLILHLNVVITKQSLNYHMMFLEIARKMQFILPEIWPFCFVSTIQISESLADQNKQQEMPIYLPDLF